MTLESQYKEFMRRNPNSALTFEEWYETKFSKLGEIMMEKLKEIEKGGFDTEKPYHFFCGECKELWSISDYKPNRDEELTCPHCGFISNVI